MTIQELFKADVQIERNIPYGENERQRLDVYSAQGEPAAPVVVWFYGGGWRSGDKRLFEHLGRAFAVRGITAVTVNYRLTPEVRFPTHAQDAAAAIEWVSREIGGYGGDPRQLFLAGHSAGAQIAAITYFDRRFLTSAARESIRGVICISGVYDLEDHVDSTVFTAREQVEEAFGASAGELSAASPYHYVEPNDVPCLIITAEKDPEGLKRQAKSFADRLREERNEVIYLDVKGRDHFSIVRRFGPGDDTAAEAIGEFIHTISARYRSTG